MVAAFISRFPRIRSELGGRENRLLDIAETQDLRIAWTSGDGKVLFDSERLWDQPDAESLFPRLNRVSDDRWRGRIREGNRVWLVLAYPLPERNVNSAPRNYLIVARPRPTITAIKQFRRSIAQPLIQAGLLAFGVGLVLALVISRSIAKPLRHVSGAAIAIAEGDLNARAPESGPAEVRQVAHAFNQM